MKKNKAKHLSKIKRQEEKHLKGYKGKSHFSVGFFIGDGKGNIIHVEDTNG